MKKAKHFTLYFLMLSVLFYVTSVAADTTTPPSQTVKLIFIHHSTGGNWLADPNSEQPYGGLGVALMNNNYFVSATNYGWGPESIGDRTDIPNWTEWFTGPNSSSILNSLYGETGQNIGDFGAWQRLPSDPGGENRIVMFKSCFPNSGLNGNPTDPPASEPNDWELSVSNAKAVYNKILTYFATRPDKLFIVITAPPLRASETTSAQAANARAFNNWLINNWLAGYSHNNVAVFDYFNVLTHPDNHHRIVSGNIEHYTSPQSGNFAYYPSGDSHPSTTGHQKATTEFVPLLNYYYNRWKASGTVVIGNIDGSTDGKVDLSDVIMGLRICAGLTPAGIVLGADVNKDNKIGPEEVIYALQVTAGIR